MPDWSPSIGAIVDGDASTFRVWAPERTHVELVLDRPAPQSKRAWNVLPLSRDESGYWSARVDGIGHGARYRFRLDSDPALVFPDPASRAQPDGVHGASMVVDPGRFRWTDSGWNAPPPADLIVYELHVGTFSREGTFRGAIDHLPHLTRLGVTAIELMPVADFPGDRNWGYDGVSLFAPARAYGTPDDLRALVDAAHGHGLAVILDVVYNHFGPDGAYVHAFSPAYFTSAHRTAWGDAINLDGPHCREVRRFFIDNALHWVREYHVDGLRLDATHALHDDGRVHFLAELTGTVRAHAGRPVVIVAEDHRNLACMMRPVESGGYGLDAVWADDFHHQVRVHVARDSEGYYRDYRGTTEDLAATIRQGWFFTGQRSEHLDGPRGTSPSNLPPSSFVICIQNHDQVGNRADGARLHHEIDPAAYRAASALLVLAPQVPLLFMGQEWAASSPFQFFTDHHDRLAPLVTEGRRHEFRDFDAFRDPATLSAIPDPQQPETFLRSRLNWQEIDRTPHGQVLRLYQRLIALRRELVSGGGGCPPFDARALDEHTVLLVLRTAGGANVFTVVRLSGAGTVHVPVVNPHRLLSTEDDAFVSQPLSIDVRTIEAAELRAEAGCCRVAFARPGAVVLHVGSAFPGLSESVVSDEARLRVEGHVPAASVLQPLVRH